MVRCALYAKGKRWSLLGVPLWKVRVQKPSVPAIVRPQVICLRLHILKDTRGWDYNDFPALNLSGGKTSGAADKFGLWNKWSTFSSARVNINVDNLFILYQVPYVQLGVPRVDPAWHVHLSVWVGYRRDCNTWTCGMVTNVFDCCFTNLISDEDNYGKCRGRLKQREHHGLQT